MKRIAVAAALGAILTPAAPASGSARALTPTRIRRVQLQVVPDELAEKARERLSFQGCGGPGRLSVEIDGRRVLSRPQRRPCRERVVAWSTPGCATAGDRVTVRIKIGRRPWSRLVSAAVGAAGADPVGVTLTTADLHAALSPEPPLAFGALYSAMATIHVSDGVQYQGIRGFGAAMTDSSAWLLYDELTPGGRQAAMRALFGRCGIGLDYVRVPIGASDFTATGVPYSYDDMPSGESDPALTRFSIAHDEPYVLPALRAMLALNPSVEILASPWSAPGWMKANDALDNVAYQGSLLPQSYQAYANYLVRFIQAYAAAGVPVADITPENEAGTPTQYPSMTLDEDTFLTDYLAPTLQRAGLPTAVYALDGSGYAGASEMLSGPVRDSIAGVAWHCYAGLEQMSALHAIDPAASLIMDECSPGVVSYPTSETVIASVRNYAEAVELWNLALDPAGGPKQQVPGCLNCSGVLTVSDRTRSATLNLNYYQLGQASKFVQRGAVRIASDSGCLGLLESRWHLRRHPGPRRCRIPQSQRVEGARRLRQLEPADSLAGRLARAGLLVQVGAQGHRHVHVAIGATA